MIGVQDGISQEIRSQMERFNNSEVSRDIVRKLLAKL